MLITLKTQKLERFVLFSLFATSADLLHDASPFERRILTTKTSALKRQVFRTQRKRNVGLGSANGSDRPSSWCGATEFQGWQSESGEKGLRRCHSRNFRFAFHSRVLIVCGYRRRLIGGTWKNEGTDFACVLEKPPDVGPRWAGVCWSFACCLSQ